MENNKKKYAVFTIDVETFSDTECIYNSGAYTEDDMLDGLDEYINLLEKFNIKATMFSVCSAAEKIKESIKDYIKRGHSLALHGYDHTAPEVLDKETFKAKTLLAKTKLEEMFNIKIKGFRAPFFSLNDEQLEIIKNLGFTYDASHNGFPAARHAGNLDLSKFCSTLNGVFKKDTFYEFGLVCQKFIGALFPICGGGYTRLMHWPILKASIKKYIKNNDYYVFYLHPFELSGAKVPNIKGLKSYDKYYLTQGLKTFRQKIISIIEMLKEEGYEFVTFDELVEIMNNKPTKV